jgi:hypothetical protein
MKSISTSDEDPKFRQVMQEMDDLFNMRLI